jgi:polysaccharide deacetylase family protein (PEP-CTERM system associated)
MTPPPPAADPRVINAMTVDVEDYFHVSNFNHVVTRTSWEQRESRVERNTDRLLRMFADAGVRATFFVLGWAGERCPALVRRIAAEGHEVASHGYGHHLVYDLTPAQFRDDVRRSKGILEDTAGVPVTGYRAPSFTITERSLWALDVLIEEGYQYDSSIFPVHHDRYGIPSSPRHAHVLTRAAGAILEIPASTVRLGGVNLPVGGGGYFRLLPYAWTRWGIARLNRVEGRPAVFYLHPWELDPDQPRLPAGALARFRHYGNLARTEARLRSLVQEFAFGPMSRLVEAAAPGVARSPREAYAPQGS